MQENNTLKLTKRKQRRENLINFKNIPMWNGSPLEP